LLKEKAFDRSDKEINPFEVKSGKRIIILPNRKAF
jgi:hypothetical protein